MERKKGGGHKIFDDQNVGGHKMTIDTVYFVQKEWFQYSFSLFRGKVYGWWGVVEFLSPKYGEVAILLTPTFCKSPPPYFEENENP